MRKPPNGGPSNRTQRSGIIPDYEHKPVPSVDLRLAGPKRPVDQDGHADEQRRSEKLDTAAPDGNGDHRQHRRGDDPLCSHQKALEERADCPRPEDALEGNGSVPDDPEARDAHVDPVVENGCDKLDHAAASAGL